MISDNAPEFPARNLTEAEQLEFYRKRYGPMDRQLKRQKAIIVRYKASLVKLSNALKKVKASEDRDTLRNLLAVAEEIIGRDYDL